MEKVLIPMDFTPVSMNALKYAASMLKDAEFHLVHCTVSLPAHQDHYSGTSDTKSSILHRELTNLVKTTLSKQELPSNFKVKILLGETITSLRIYEKEQNFDLVFMGTRDKYDIIDKWIGTFSLGVLKTLKASVYLIPPFARYNGIKKVLVATDEKLENPYFPKAIKEWNRDYRAFAKFLHVRKKDNEDMEGQVNSIVNEFFREGEPDFAFEFTSIKSKDVSQSLLAAAYNFGADLLISTPSEQSFLNALIFKSLSKELVLKSEIPLLFLKK